LIHFYKSNNRNKYIENVNKDGGVHQFRVQL